VGSEADTADNEDRAGRISNARELDSGEGEQHLPPPVDADGRPVGDCTQMAGNGPERPIAADQGERDKEDAHLRCLLLFWRRSQLSGRDSRLQARKRAQSCSYALPAAERRRMQLCTNAGLSHREARRLRASFKVCDDRLLVHAMVDISIPAKAQQHNCTMRRLSFDANYTPMNGLEADTKLITDLCDFAGKKPSRIAAELGLAATTLTRPVGGKATTRIGRTTIEALRAAYPDFPGWGAEQVTANAIPFKMEGASDERMRDNLPIYGTAIGTVKEIDGHAIEQTALNTGDIAAYAKRPVILNGNSSAYGLWITGSSMEPRFMEGETILIDPNGRLRNGDDVVVYLRPTSADDDDGQTARAVMVKRLVRRTSTWIELEQFSPAKVFRVDMVEVTRVDRVIPWSELLS
jgi:hypothetical protein